MIKDMKRIIILIAAGCMAFSARSQTITFHSPEFEIGVKKHLELGLDDQVIQSQTDTITMLDLSNLGITDVRDLCYLPNVRSLNLSTNGISDISPLLALDSLQRVDLSWNKLESIDLLAFASSGELLAYIGYNYIQDFGFLMSPSACHLNLIGMGGQLVKDAPYFDVCNLCADMDADGVPVLNYRGYTNMEDAAFVDCGTVHEAAVMDGDTYTVTLSGITETTKAYLGNGAAGDSTYVVPPANLEVEPGESLTFATGLPEGYSLRGFSPAQQGTMEIEGTNLVYTPAEGFESEEYMFAYYEGMQLRGFSKVTLRPEVFVLGDANGDGHVRVGDVSAILNYLVGLVPANFKAKRADANGDGKIRVGDASAVLTMIVNQ